MRGDAGDNGIRRPPGEIGLRGPPGKTGFDGIPGFSGFKGEKGRRGACDFKKINGLVHKLYELRKKYLDLNNQAIRALSS
ncbi:ryncolin-2-like [Hydractinia symbiolongicarpus]|uniref:ryncolin-2-like n=1 Tax=Hydractinia symbiolongicarpus TaxID=13093 RepID=UPI00254FE3E8|nr:ryncolin-2-like [Hydractinia symbiolongicarpus]XP_057297032.1 ryncolin-2-like [Hydractinia symbiolongicarpus]